MVISNLGLDNCSILLSSGGVRRGLTGRTVTPTPVAPNRIGANSGQFGTITAILSP